MDKSFLNKIQQVILKHLEDENLNVETLAFEIGLSRSQLFRNIKAQTGKSVNQFIREIRLKEAAKLIQKDEFTISEISYKVGFNSPSYFNKCFHDNFGLTPGDYREQSEEEIKKIKENVSSANIIIFKKPKFLFSVIILLIVLLLTSLFIKRNFLHNNKLQNSIAVLYFDDMSSGGDTQWFCDGITDEIYTYLSKLKNLKVISRTSVKRYQDSDMKMSKIARELDVSYIVEGSVKKQDDMIRIVVKLINSFDKTIWSKEFDEKFDEKAENVLKIQKEVSMLIVEHLQLVISPEEVEILNEKSTDNLRAYELYLRGRFYWHQRTKNDLERSIYYYNRALELDSTYALAYAGLADVYFVMAREHLYPGPWSEGYDKGKEFALKALSLNHNLSEAHATLGAIAIWHEWNWEGAEEELKLAISLNPNNAMAHRHYYTLLELFGKYKEAREELDLAIRLNPHSIILYIIRGHQYLNEGNYDKAIAESQKIRNLNKHYRGNFWFCFKIYMTQNKYRLAIDELKKYDKSNDLTEKYSFNIEEVYQASGIEGIYRELILHALKKPDSKSSLRLARFYVLLGEDQKALDILENIFVKRKRGILFAITDSEFKDLRSEPRFQAILKKMNLEYEPSLIK